MDKQRRQVRKVPECEKCKNREQVVENVIKKIEKSKTKKKSLFDFLRSIDGFNHSVIL